MRTVALENYGLLRRDTTGTVALSAPAMIMLSIAGAVLTAVLAQIRVPIPGTPVPFTGQVLGVLLCGGLLGGGYGCLSQALYVGAGVAGIPWFTGSGIGLAYLSGPTGGYLIGFIAAAAFLGVAIRAFNLGRSYIGVLAMMAVAIAIIYAFGAAHLMFFLGRGFGAAFNMNVVCFLAGDIVKALIAAKLVTAAARYAR